MRGGYLDFEVQIVRLNCRQNCDRGFSRRNCSDSKLGSLIILSGTVHTGVEVYRMDLWNDLGFSLYAVLSVYHIVTTSDDGKKSEMEVSFNWCVAIEHQRLSSIRDYLC